MRGQGQLQVDSMHQSEQLEWGYVRAWGNLSACLAVGCHWNHSVAALQKQKSNRKKLPISRPSSVL